MPSKKPVSAKRALLIPYGGGDETHDFPSLWAERSNQGISGSSSFRQLVTRVSDQLKAGEIRLIDTTPEEREEAKNRLDAHRAKRRKRHARKKAASEF